LASVVLLGGGTALGLAFTASAAPLDDTTTPVPTQPTPDPAPPAPKPKPAAKPAPKRTYTPPKSTYTPPTRTYSTPTYTPSRSSVTTPRVTRKVRKHKARTHKKPAPVVVTSTPAETTPAPAAVIPPAIPVGAQVGRSSGNAVASMLFIAGVTFAALLFLLAAAVPGTSVRFTPVGRVVLEHQQDLVLVGVGAFVITVFVYLITGHGL
jgi:hypothetical protein